MSILLLLDTYGLRVTGEYDFSFGIDAMGSLGMNSYCDGWTSAVEE